MAYARKYDNVRSITQSSCPFCIRNSAGGFVAAWERARTAQRELGRLFEPSMLHPGQAELAVRLIEHAHAHHEQNFGAAAGPIVVSEYLNASDAYTGTGVLMSPALRSGTLQLITIALLAGWFGFHRFGPPGKTFEGQRRSLTESAIAVGNLHYRTSSGSEAVRSYLEYVKSQLQKLIGRSVGLADIARISARSGLSEDDVGMRLRLARDLAGQQGTPAQEAAAAVRGLSEILDRLHGNRTDE